MYYCVNCGNPIEEDDVFCSNCGAAQTGRTDRAQSVPDDNISRTVPSADPESAFSGQPEPARLDPAIRHGAGNTIFAVISSFLVFVILCIPLHVTTGSVWSSMISDKPLVVNGLDIILKQDFLLVWWGKNAQPAMIVCIVCLAVALILLLLSILTYVIRKGNTAVTLVTIVIDALLSVMYCAAGFLCVNLTHPSYAPKTYSYFAPIVFVVFLIIFIVIKIVLAKKKKQL